MNKFITLFLVALCALVLAQDNFAPTDACAKCENGCATDKCIATDAEVKLLVEANGDFKTCANILCEKGDCANVFTDANRDSIVPVCYERPPTVTCATVLCSEGTTCVEVDGDVKCIKDQECTPGDAIVAEDKCVTCKCNTAGDGKICETNRDCVEPVDPVCEKGDVKDDDCNTCSCHNGQWLCTLMACIEPECKAGETKKVDCNTCECSDVGLWACTKVGCVDPVEPPTCVEGAVRLADDSCENNCVCIDGKEACTDKICKPDPEFVCKTGDVKKTDDGCNECFCSDNAWACTERACECKAGTRVAKGDCNWCECGDAGQWKCTDHVCEKPECKDTDALVKSDDSCTVCGCKGGFKYCVRPHDAVCKPGDVRKDSHGCKICKCGDCGVWNCDTVRDCVREDKERIVEIKVENKIEGFENRVPTEEEVKEWFAKKYDGKEVLVTVEVVSDGKETKFTIVVETDEDEKKFRDEAEAAFQAEGYSPVIQQEASSGTPVTPVPEEKNSAASIFCSALIIAIAALF